MVFFSIYFMFEAIYFYYTAFCSVLRQKNCSYLGLQLRQFLNTSFQIRPFPFYLRIL